jgi:hypothetical protein
VRERRRPRMPNQIGSHPEQRIIAFALGHPGYGARRMSAELARAKWGGIPHLRARRLAGPAPRRPQHAQQAPGVDRAPPCPLRAPPRPAAGGVPHRRHDARQEGPARLLLRRPTRRHQGTVWQYTAIDVASAYCWAELHTSERNPRSRHTGEFVHRVAAELAHAGWRSCTRSPPTTAPSSAPERSAPPSTASARASASSAPAGPTATVASNASNSPRGMLATRVRALTRTQEHGTSPGPRRLSQRVQLRPRLHRAPHPGTRARRHRLRRPQDQHPEMTSRRYISGLGRPNALDCIKEASSSDGHRVTEERSRSGPPACCTLDWIDTGGVGVGGCPTTRTPGTGIALGSRATPRRRRCSIPRARPRPRI